MRESNSGFLISHAQKLGGRIFERILAEAGVDAFNGAQGRILYVLWQEDGVPMRVLSARTGLARNTLTSMLDRMEAADLAARHPDGADRRSVRIRLTQKARALRDKYDAVSSRMNEIYFQGFTDDEIAQLEGALRRIIRNLEEADENG